MPAVLRPGRRGSARLIPGLVVDLGCGPGELTAALAERWPGAEVIGVDSSPEMIEAAQAMPAPARRGRLSFALGDLRDWRPTRPVDVIVSNAVLQWVPGHLDCSPAGRASSRPAAGWRSRCPATSTSPATRSCASSPRRPLAPAAGRRAAEPPGRGPGRVPGPAGRAGCGWTPGRRPTCTCCRATTRCSSGTRAPGCARCWPRCRRARPRAFLAEYARPVREAYPAAPYGTRAAVPAGVRGGGHAVA